MLLLALLAPWLYDRYLAFSSLIANRPSKYSKLRTFKSHEILYRDELRNCEDVVMEKSLGLAFLSCDPGRDHWNTVMVRLPKFNLTHSTMQRPLTSPGHFPIRKPSRRQSRHLRLRLQHPGPQPLRTPNPAPHR